MSETGILYLVSTPIGNLGDVTRRAVEVLGECDLLLAEDTRRTRVLLEHCGVKARELRSFHRHNAASRSAQVRESLAGGSSVALVSDSGTPLISDPGLRLVHAAIDVGARVIPVPGPSAALAALVASGLDPQPFTFFGFPPRSGPERKRLLERLAALDHTAVLFESPQRLVDTLDEFSTALGGDRPVTIARELTKLHEEFYRGTLAEAAAYYREHAPRGEIVICLAGSPTVPTADREEAARATARALARIGASSRDIVRALKQEHGLERNRAYELALEVAGEGAPGKGGPDAET